MDTKTFLKYYKDLPTKNDQKHLRNKIIKACKIQKPTFYSWFQRGYIPDDKCKKIIADLLGQSVESLFPVASLQEQLNKIHNLPDEFINP